MKLNKLTSAVSVSLLAVALTACGSSKDDAPIIGTPTTTTQPPTTTAPVVDNSAKLAQITANAKAAGLSDAAAAAFAAANVGLDIGSEAYQKALAEALAKQNTTNTTGVNNAVSPVVEAVNPFIGKVDASTQATTTANVYTRQEGSQFDRSANPAQYGGLGAVGVDDPTPQNPYLSNYVLAVETVTDANGNKKITAIDSTGELVKKGTKVADNESPYATSRGLRYETSSAGGNRTYHYGGGADTSSDTNATGFNALTDAAKALVFKDSNEKASHNSVAALADLPKNIATIQEVNKHNVAEDLTDDAKKAVIAAKADSVNLTRADGYLASDKVKAANSGLVVYNPGAVAVAGIGKGSMNVPVYGVEENTYQLDSRGKLVVANAVNPALTKDTAVAKHNEAFYAREIVPTTLAGDATGREYAEAQIDVDAGTAADAKGFAHAVAVANKHMTRVFGKNYKSAETDGTKANTYANTYVGRYNSKNVLSSQGVTTTTLENVQYGRLTNNIDVLANRKASDAQVITYRQFQEHGAPNTVDTYFYRGTNHTSLAQMQALKARGGVVQYYGHALTYGVGPIVNAKVESNGLPTAYGNATTGTHTIGNFVQAQYDIAAGKVNGSIYNFRNDDLAKDKDNFVRQDLITFSGNVVGNTVIGTSANLSNLEAGSLTASFYGPQANEIGGAVSYIPRELGYSTPKWGAVFGATKGTAIENFNVIEQGR